MALEEHNAIKVNCNAVDHFNGPEKFYIAHLYYGETQTVDIVQTRCDFIFKDLSYSTEYIVKVCRILIFLCHKIYSLYSVKFYNSWSTDIVSLQVFAFNGNFNGTAKIGHIKTSCMCSKHPLLYIVWLI